MVLTLKYREQTAQYFTEVLGADADLDMMQIPAGGFWMGTSDDEIERLCQESDVEYFRREAPQHWVNIAQFYLGRYPVTQAQWKIVAAWEKEELDLQPEPSHFKDDFETEVNGESKVFAASQRPVEQVSWLEVKEFCARLSRKSRRHYRLVTEAEWEYACRGINPPLETGASPTISQVNWNREYHQPFHSGETLSTTVANYDGDYRYGRGEKGLNRGQTNPVGYFDAANNFGLSDMHGNVWEWCEDDYHQRYQDEGVQINPDNLEATKVLRGGSWFNAPGFCRSAYRYYYSREYKYNNIGFRVACSLSS